MTASAPRTIATPKTAVAAPASTTPGGARHSRTPPAAIRLITLETPPADRPVELGEMVSVAAVEASNIIKDVRELITNALGGRMRRYEKLLDRTLETALGRFREELSAQGYDGALGVRIAHPTLVQGGAELIVYGTGFRYVAGDVASE